MMDYDKHVRPFSRVGFYADGDGYIVWRTGVEGNVELLSMEVREKRKGYGTRLVRMMTKALVKHPPHCTVYGMVRGEDVDCQAFLESMGFDLSEIDGVYCDGNGLVFSQSFEQLRERHLGK